MSKPRATWPTEPMAHLKHQCRFRDDYQRKLNALENRVKATCRRIQSTGGYPEDEDGREALRKKAETMFKKMESAFKTISEAPHDERNDARLIVIASLRAEIADLYTQLEPLFESRAPLLIAIDAKDKIIEKCVKHLPCWKWVDQSPYAKGVGAILYGRLIGATGTLATYRKSQLVMRRMATSVVDGYAQGRRKSREEAQRHGYRPAHRTLMWLIASGIVRAQVRADKDENGKKTGKPSTAIGPLGEYYLTEKARIHDLNSQGHYAARAAAEVVKARGKGYKPAAANLDGRLTDAHVDNMAKRKLAGVFIRMLWRQWRDEAQQDLSAPMMMMAAE